MGYRSHNQLARPRATRSAATVTPTPALPPRGPDLRKPDLRRVLLDRLLDRADHLPPHERALIHLIYSDGRPITELAHLVGVGRSGAQSLRRQVRRLVLRVLSPKFEFVLRHQAQWRPTRRRVAVACILHGLTRQQAAAELGLSPHVVRRHHEAVEALFDTCRSTTR